MRILVFGGLGFIGYHLVSRLLSSGHDVTIIDNANDYGQFNKHILDQIYADRYATIADARWIRSDLNGFDDEGMIRSHDMIVMLAGYPSAKLVDLNLSMARSLMVDSLSALCGMIGAIFVSAPIIPQRADNESRSLMVDSLSALCGMIGADTKIAFVSRSGRAHV